MLKALNKKRSANFYSNQVKFLLLIVIGVLIYNSNDARFFISDQLNNASEIVRPDAQLNFRYWLTQTMAIMNPYVENLVSMGYDRKDVETASTMFQKKTFPYTIHGRTYQTEEEYNEAIHDFMNGM